MGESRFRSFFLPRFSLSYLLRLVIIAALAIVFFSKICIPVRIEGISMEPTYHDGSFNFCCRVPYFFHPPSVGDVVFIRMAGTRVMYMKRVVAMAGNVVAFQDGYLYVNGKVRPETYVVTECDWDLPPRKVKPRHVYVVGDNRKMTIENQVFGQVPASRIVGKALW